MRGTSLTLVVAVLAGCVRVVTPLQQVTDAGAPAVRVDRVGVLAVRLGAEPVFPAAEAPDGSAVALEVFAGDALVVDGANWDPLQAEVTIGGVRVSVEESGSSATRLQVRIPSQRVDGAVQVAMPSSRALSRETVAFRGAGRLGNLQDRGTVSPQLAVQAAGAMHGCAGGGGLRDLGGGTTVPEPGLDPAGNPSCHDSRHAGLAVVFNLGLSPDPSLPAYWAVLGAQGAGAQMGEALPLDPEPTGPWLRQYSSLRAFRRSPEAAPSFVGVERVFTFDEAQPQPPTYRLITDLGPTAADPALRGPLFFVDPGGWIALRIEPVEHPSPTPPSFSTRLLFFRELEAPDGGARWLAPQPDEGPRVDALRPIAAGYFSGAFLPEAVRPFDPAPVVAVAACAASPTPEDPQPQLELWWAPVDASQTPPVGGLAVIPLGASICSFLHCPSEGGVSLVRDLVPWRAGTFVVLPSVEDDPGTQATVCVIGPDVAPMDSRVVGGGEGGTGSGGRDTSSGGSASGLGTGSGTGTASGGGAGASGALSSGGIPPPLDGGWPPPPDGAACPDGGYCPHAAPMWQPLSVATVAHQDAPVLLGIIDEQQFGGTRAVFAAHELDGTSETRLASPFIYDVVAADGTGTVFAVPPWGGYVHILDADANLAAVSSILGAPSDAWPLPDTGELLVAYDGALLTVDINGKPSFFVPGGVVGFAAVRGRAGVMESLLVGTFLPAAGDVWRPAVVRLDPADTQSGHVTEWMAPADSTAWVYPVAASASHVLVVRGVVDPWAGPCADYLGRGGTDPSGGQDTGQLEVYDLALIERLDPPDPAAAHLEPLPASCGAWPLALGQAAPVVWAVQQLPGEPPAAALWAPDANGEVVPVDQPPRIPVSLLALPWGGALGVTLDPQIFTAQLTCFPADPARAAEAVLLGPPPVAQGVFALSPDQSRLYAGTVQSILELEFPALDADGCPVAPAAGLRVLRRVRVDGTPTSMALDATGERLVWVDRDSQQVGVVE